MRLWGEGKGGGREKQDDLMASNLFSFQENGGEGEAVGRGEGGGREKQDNLMASNLFSFPPSSSTLKNLTTGFVVVRATVSFIVTQHITPTSCDWILLPTVAFA